MLTYLTSFKVVELAHTYTGGLGFRLTSRGKMYRVGGEKREKKKGEKIRKKYEKHG